ncbi:MAG: hypothetical protein RIR49_1405 [Actinomycetota bacterium]|jgi:hypothetical protein
MREAPSVEEASRLWAEELVVIGVGWSGEELTYRDFIAEGGLTFPQIDDSAGEVYGRFGIPFQPAVVLIRPDGTPTTLLGEIAASDVEEFVRSLEDGA